MELLKYLTSTWFAEGMGILSSRGLGAGLGNGLGAGLGAGLCAGLRSGVGGLGFVSSMANSYSNALVQTLLFVKVYIRAVWVWPSINSSLHSCFSLSRSHLRLLFIRESLIIERK